MSIRGGLGDASTSGCRTSSGTRSTPTCPTSRSRRRPGSTGQAGLRPRGDAGQAVQLSAAGRVDGRPQRAGWPPERPREGRFARPRHRTNCTSITGSSGCSARSGAQGGGRSATTSARAATTCSCATTSTASMAICSTAASTVSSPASRRLLLRPVDRQEPLPRRHARAEGEPAPICSSARPTRSERRPTSRARVTPPQRPAERLRPTEQDEGPSDFDIRHKLVGLGNWMIPGPARGAMDRLLGGWQVASVAASPDGTPFSGGLQRPIVHADSGCGGTIVGNSGCDYNADGARQRSSEPTVVWRRSPA